MRIAMRKTAMITLSSVLLLAGFILVVLYAKDQIATKVFISFEAIVLFLLSSVIFAYILLQNSQLRQDYHRLSEAHTELKARSRIDHMTGLLNREALFEAIKISRSRIDYGTLLVVDADHFKAINDTFGHSCGDRALKLIAFALQNVTRKGDLVGRIGGEEFCIFLPGASAETGVRVAQRIRMEVENMPFHATEYQAYPLTISIGGALAPKNETNSQVLSRADRCLYVAKQRGRNCVVFDEDSVSTGTSSVISLSKGRESAVG